MRKNLTIIAVTLLAATSALSGCFGKDDKTGATDGTTPTPTPPVDSTPTPPADGGDNSTEPPEETPPPQPVEVTVELNGGAGLALSLIHI